jgi:hypothetical protein
MFKFQLDLDILFGKVSIIGGCNIGKSYFISDSHNDSSLAPDGRPFNKNGWEIHASFHVAEWLQKAIDGAKEFFHKVAETAKRVWNNIVDEIKVIGKAIKDFFSGPNAPFMKFVNSVKDFVS